MSLSVQSVEQSTQIHTAQNTSAGISSSFKEALDAFYEIHQCSQITGVPTTIYNKVLDSLSVASNQELDAFAAISLLDKNGYDTGRPTDEAIVKYGAIDQEHGNKSYMKNGTSLSSVALKEEIEALNEETNNTYESAQNYYDVALKNIEAAPLEMSATRASLSSSTPTLLSTEDTLKNLLKNEMVSILKSDENLLKDLLKAFL